MKKLSEALTWEDLAVAYNKEHKERSAQTMPMDVIWEWAKSKTNLFKVDSKKGTIHKIIKL